MIIFWFSGTLLMAFGLASAVVSGMAHCEPDFASKRATAVIAVIATILGALLWRAA